MRWVTDEPTCTSDRVENHTFSNRLSGLDTDEVLRMPAHPVVDPLDELLTRLLESAASKEKHHDALKRRWAIVHNVLGLPAAALAAVAGAAVLASTTTRVVGGLIALVSAALTATNAFLDSSARRKEHRMLTAGWSDLHRQVELLRSFDLGEARSSTAESAALRADIEPRVRRLVEVERMLCAGILPAFASDKKAVEP
jgi:hypothetical protein